MMFKKLLDKLLITSTLITLVGSVNLLAANAQTIEIGSQLAQDPLAVDGHSGGSVDSQDCGFIGAKPHHVIKVTERIDYMRVTLLANGGEPTLLVDGPDGRFCVLADTLADGNPEISGVWLPGTYSIHVGDHTGGRHQFTLEISQRD